MDCTAIKDIRSGMKNINVIFIILESTAATKTKENREIFSFKVSDPSASINCSIWDDPGRLLVPGDIVKLTKGYASQWRNQLTLYSGKSGDIQKIGDFCMVFNEQINMSEPAPAAQQQSAAIQNHINSNGGNGNGNGRSGNSLQSSPAATSNSNTSTNSTSNSKPSKSTGSASSKSYIRKPINKK
jgi:hypothetical protein